MRLLGTYTAVLYRFASKSAAGVNTGITLTHDATLGVMTTDSDIPQGGIYQVFLVQ